MPDLPTAERQDPTEKARRAARFKAAEARIKKIVAAAPPLTAEQIAQLRALLDGGADAA